VIQAHNETQRWCLSSCVPYHNWFIHAPTERRLRRGPRMTPRANSFFFQQSFFDDAAPPLATTPLSHAAVLLHLRPPSYHRTVVLNSSRQSTTAPFSHSSFPLPVLASSSSLHPVLLHCRNPSLLGGSGLLSLQYLLFSFPHLGPYLHRSVRNPRKIQMLSEAPHDTHETNRCRSSGPMEVPLVRADISKPGCQIRV
jgi:hypothetical protein